MIFSSFPLIIKRCHQPWHSPSPLLLRTNLTVPWRNFFTNKESKQPDLLVQYPNNAMEYAKLYRKAKETAYSLVIITGVVALSGLASLILYEFCSRETPKGIFKEASKLCLADSRVQEALGAPVNVHTAPQLGSMPIQTVRAKDFDEKGHRSMTLAFYLTGQDRSSVVAVKVQKNISNKFVYDYILVQLDRPWRGQNILQICRSPSSSSQSSPDSDE